LPYDVLQFVYTVYCFTTLFFIGMKTPICAACFVRKSFFQQFLCSQTFSQQVSFKIKYSSEHCLALLPKCFSQHFPFENLLPNTFNLPLSQHFSFKTILHNNFYVPRFFSKHFLFENLLPHIFLAPKSFSSTKLIVAPRISAFSSRKTSYGKYIAYFNAPIAWSSKFISKHFLFENLLPTFFWLPKLFLEQN